MTEREQWDKHFEEQDIKAKEYRKIAKEKRTVELNKARELKEKKQLIIDTYLYDTLIQSLLAITLISSIYIGWIGFPITMLLTIVYYIYRARKINYYLATLQDNDFQKIKTRAKQERKIEVDKDEKLTLKIESIKLKVLKVFIPIIIAGLTALLIFLTFTLYNSYGIFSTGLTWKYMLIYLIYMYSTLSLIDYAKIDSSTFNNTVLFVCLSLVGLGVAYYILALIKIMWNSI